MLQRKQSRLKAFLETSEKFINVILNLLMKYKKQRAQNILLLKPIKEVTHLSLAAIQLK